MPSVWDQVAVDWPPPIWLVTVVSFFLVSLLGVLACSTGVVGANIKHM